VTNAKVPRTGFEAARTAARVVEHRKRAAELTKALRSATPETLAAARQIYEIMENPTKEITAALRIIKESELKA